MASNATKGARGSRQTVFFPPEEKQPGDSAPEPVRDQRTELPELPEFPKLAEPVEPAEPVTESLAQPATDQPAKAPEPQEKRHRHISAESKVRVTQSIPPARFNWIREVNKVGDREVFRAEEAKTGNLVTVELLSQSAAGDPELVKLFYLEAEAAARLEHPQIARATKAEPFAVTHQRQASHLPGSATLRELLAQGGWFEQVRALRVITEVAGALDYAHQAGVLHLILQPEHIWMDSDDRLLVTGFGIPGDRQSEWARSLRARRCAPPYLSPEQLGGRAGDRASDLYALGVIFYEMLTDRIPFDSDDPDELRRLHKLKTPRPPRDFNHALSPEISELVMKLLTRDPETRVRLFREANAFQSLLKKPAGAPDVEKKPPRAASTQRMTNPMPLSEIAAEVNASSAPPPSRPVEDKPDISRRFSLPPLAELRQRLSPLTDLWQTLPPLTDLWQRSRPFHRWAAVLAALGLVLWLTPMALRSNTGGPDPQAQKSDSTNTSAYGPDVTLELANAARQPMAGDAASTVTPGGAGKGTDGPSEPGRADGNAAGAVIAPPAMPRVITRAALPTSLPAEPAADGGRLSFGQPVKRVGPVYPPSALSRRQTGAVFVKVSLNEQGGVTQARVVSGPQVFHDSALAAARQWRFKPTVLDGAPVKVDRIITFHYDRPDLVATKATGLSARSKTQSPRRRQSSARRRSGNRNYR